MVKEEGFMEYTTFGKARLQIFLGEGLIEKVSLHQSISWIQQSILQVKPALMAYHKGKSP